MGFNRHQKHNKAVHAGWIFVYCFLSFCFGVLLVNRFWAFFYLSIATMEGSSNIEYQPNPFQSIAECERKKKLSAPDIVSQASKTHDVILSLDHTISSLEMELATARETKEKGKKSQVMPLNLGLNHMKHRKKAFFVMGIFTVFSSKKRRDSIRKSWMPQGNELKKLEIAKKIIIRFVIGYSSSQSGILDHAIDIEDDQHRDFLRLNHTEGYDGVTSKSQNFFITASALWDADFYVKVEDNVHVNIGVVASILFHHRSKSHVYIGCMKSGPVLAQRGVKYNEPEFWKFGEGENKYFRHAASPLYAISKDLATYISVNRNILHKYANEDVSVGSWLIGLDVEHIDDRSFCCGTPPDCEWQAQAGNPCAASFDWTCGGICKSVQRMEEIHQRCGEEDESDKSSNITAA